MPSLDLRPSRVRIGFTMRLLLVLVVALASAGVAGVWILSGSLRADQEEAAVQSLRADAHSLGRVQQLISNPDEDVLSEAREILDVIEGRPGVEQAALIDGAGLIRASGDRRKVGTQVSDVQAMRALAGTGAVTARLDDGDFKYAIPVELGSRRYALVLREDGTRFDTRVAKLRGKLIVVLAGALGGAFILFWLAGGRALTATHRDAVRRSTRDALTGLGNHRAFHEELGRAVALASRYGERVSLLAMDLDDFKLVNDRHGHASGDELLRRVGSVVDDTMRFEDRAFRIGGDEFTVILSRADEKQAEAVAHRLLADLNAAGISASIGVSALEPTLPDVAALREEADAALYKAKAQGRNRAIAFSAIRAEASVVTAAKRAALVRLLEQPEIDIAFQPIWDLGPGVVLGVEALARPPKDLGFASPADAFDTAQQTGDVHALDLLCARSAIRAARDLPPGVKLFVNLTPQSIAVGRELLTPLAAEVAEAGLTPDRIVIEVTERLGARPDAVIRGAAELLELGFRLALDDVGAGNSGLQTLRLLTLDYVKVDRSICVAALEDDAARAVLQAINAYAREAGAFVIIEGIEDADMLTRLQTLHEQPPTPAIRGGQGFGLGRPAPSLEAALAAQSLAPVTS